jgi:hypothetical protein
VCVCVCVCVCDDDDHDFGDISSTHRGTHAQTRTHTYERTHTHTHTHTHTGLTAAQVEFSVSPTTVENTKDRGRTPDFLVEGEVIRMPAMPAWSMDGGKERLRLLALPLSFV